MGFISTEFMKIYYIINNNLTLELRYLLTIFKIISGWIKLQFMRMMIVTDRTQDLVEFARTLLYFLT